MYQVRVGSKLLDLFGFQNYSYIDQEYIDITNNQYEQCSAKYEKINKSCQFKGTRTLYLN